MGGDRLDRGKAEGFARPDVEPGPVPGATDLGPVQVPFGQRAAVVSADVVDGVKLPVDVEDRDRPAFQVNQLLAAWRDLVEKGDLREVRHRGSIRL